MGSTTALATKQGSALVTAKDATAIRTALKTSLYPGASDASVDLVLAYCEASGLDPMTKPVHIVPMSVSTGRKDNNGWDIKETRDVIMPGIALYRVNASRTGLYAGCSEPEFGPTRELKYTREVWSGPQGSRKKTEVEGVMSYPEYCRVTVRKLLGGTVVEFTAIEYWLENYASKGDGGAPNAMWEKRPFGQLAKCTEAQALRKAFPEAVGAQPTAEEMEGKHDFIDVESTVVTTSTRPAMPSAKPKAEPQPGIDVEPDAATPPAAEAAQGEPGISGLTEGMKKMLMVKAKNAGYADEATLLERHRSINAGNLNDVLAALQAEANRADEG